MKAFLGILVVASALFICIIAVAQGDAVGIPSKKLQAGGDSNKVYFLIGPGKDDKRPDRGYKLLIVLPGGDGSESFRPFVERIYKCALPKGYLIAQLVAVKWTPVQQIVWPHKRNAVSGMRFSTEEFIDAVVADAGKYHKLDPKYVFTLAWSSGGPAAYAASLQHKTSITGTYVVMSVFDQKQLPPLSAAKEHAYYIEHSPDDKICPFWMAEKARSELSKAGGKVEFSKYEGGHGWRGDAYGRMRKAILWLEKNAK